jgi:hypothetical protein
MLWRDPGVDIDRLHDRIELLVIQLVELRAGEGSVFAFEQIKLLSDGDTSGRAGSIMPIMPRKTRSRSISSAFGSDGASSTGR